MRAIVLSGGASKGAFTAGAVRYLLEETDKTFDLAVGTSTGTLVAGPTLLGDADYVQNVYVNVEDEDIFQNSAIGMIANAISNFVNFISGPIDARLDPLRRLLEEYYYGDEKLNELLASGKEMVVSIANVRTGKIQFVSSNMVKNNDIRKETFINAIIASCSGPFFTKPIQVFELEPNHPNQLDLYYDGGVKEFIPVETAAQMKADEIWVICTHPLEFEETPWGGRGDPGEVSFLKALPWTIGAFFDEVARGDLFRAHTYYRWAKLKALIEQEAPQLLGRNEFKEFLYGFTLPDLHLIYPDEHLPTSMKFEPATMRKYALMGYRRAKKMIESNTDRLTDETLKPWELHYGEEPS